MDYLSTSEPIADVSGFATRGLSHSDAISFGQPMINPAEYNAFLSLMLSTIDVEELSQNYYQYLAGKLPLKGLTFAAEDRQFVSGSHASREHIVSLQTTAASAHKPPLAHTIHYHFQRLITLREQHLLHELHTHFCVPLLHALSYRKLQLQATRDALTGLGNRAEFEQQLLRFFSQAQRHDIPFGLLVIDLDNFKQLNDQQGHLEGDKALIRVANQLQLILRDEDIAFRFGGDEFCCLLNSVSIEQLESVAQRIRAGIAAESVLLSQGITASIGGTLAIPDESGASLFERADTAVYQVKADAKNNVVIL
ncbi:GGDEF domain-containing protein [Alteromonas oceanisediminis]|uniref:GGDEF domain-containing protein n=1 Tax=Alteromonas oceanisediminis TaxID=2836180 RepID=UPI001BD9B664|nr:GGDEF domain-containing protein [Alteromonas oceanisediminis]MBT0584997.1 GGDEF domain-containing protein [Alteromonas oceanisediminis]